MASKLSVRWAKGAEADLVQIIGFIANDSPHNARAVLLNIRRRTAELVLFPNRGRVIPELEAQGVSMYRELIVNPWRIMYRVYDKGVIIIAVIDSHKNIEDVLLSRMVR